MERRDGREWTESAGPSLFLFHFDFVALLLLRRELLCSQRRKQLGRGMVSYLGEAERISGLFFQQGFFVRIQELYFRSNSDGFSFGAELGRH